MDIDALSEEERMAKAQEEFEKLIALGIEADNKILEQIQSEPGYRPMLDGYNHRFMPNHRLFRRRVKALQRKYNIGPYKKK